MVTERSAPPTAILPFEELLTAYKVSPTDPVILCTQPLFSFTLKSHKDSYKNEEDKRGWHMQEYNKSK